MSLIIFINMLNIMINKKPLNWFSGFLLIWNRLLSKII